jgi:hypothetical protein
VQPDNEVIVIAITRNLLPVTAAITSALPLDEMKALFRLLVNASL